jgi:hypothetical protein
MEYVRYVLAALFSAGCAFAAFLVRTPLKSAMVRRRTRRALRSAFARTGGLG